VLDMVFKGEVAVKNDSEVADVWGGGRSVKCEGFLGEGFVRFITVECEEVVLHPGFVFQ